MKVPTEPHPVSQPFRLIQTQPSKENLHSSIYPPHPGHNILRDNYVLSHQNFYMSSPQSRVVESREKARMNLINETVHVKSRQGSPVNQLMNQSNSRSKVIRN